MKKIDLIGSQTDAVFDLLVGFGIKPNEFRKVQIFAVLEDGKDKVLTITRANSKGNEPDKSRKIEQKHNNQNYMEQKLPPQKSLDADSVIHDFGVKPAMTKREELENVLRQQKEKYLAVERVHSKDVDRDVER